MKKWLVYLVVLPAAVIFLLVFLAVGFSPSVSVDSGQQVGEADTIQPLINQTRTVIQERFDPHTVTIKQQQAISLVGFLTRSHEPLSVDLELAKDELILQASYRLNQHIYINLSTTIVSAEKLQLSMLSVGQIYLPGNLGLWIAEVLTDWYTQSDIASQTIATIQSVNITEEAVTVAFAPVNQALKEIREINLGGDESQKRLQKIRIAHYLAFLDSLPPPPVSPSLNTYMVALMQEAQHRSRLSSAVDENQAAILALAIYAGDRRFAAAVGNMDFVMPVIPTLSMKPLLRYREDLSLHFIFSAAIKLLSEQDFSFAVGEFKELMDRAQGGSGYSFVDLAADMAGVNFAVIASSDEHAAQVQSIIVESNSEDAFMPEIVGLREGMSKSEFTRLYGNVDSEKYRQTIHSIQQRIAQLPVSIGR